MSILNSDDSLFKLAKIHLKASRIDEAITVLTALENIALTNSLIVDHKGQPAPILGVEELTLDQLKRLSHLTGDGATSKVMDAILLLLTRTKDVAGYAQEVCSMTLVQLAPHENTILEYLAKNDPEKALVFAEHMNKLRGPQSR